MRPDPAAAGAGRRTSNSGPPPAAATPQGHPRTMLKKTILAVALLLPLAAQAQEVKKTNVAGALNWTVQASWPLPAKPLDLVHSLDNKKVFILTADNKVHIFAADGRKLGEMEVEPDTVAIDIAPRGEMLYLINGRTNTFTAMDIGFSQQIDITGAPVRGKVDAPVTLVVFSDFECPWCGKLEPVLAQLLAANPDKVRVVFKHLPLPMHAQAEPAALAAIAAQRQGKFWEMHDGLFMTQQWTPNTVTETATRVGLDMTRFQADLNSQETRMQLAKDRADAQAAEVNATPSIFVNGRPARERSLPALQAMVDEALAAGGAK